MDMQKDVRDTPLYRDAESLYRKIRRPGSGLISDASEVTTNATHAAFAGTLVDDLNGLPPTRVCLTSLETGDTRVLTFGPNVDRLPKFSPDGRRIAFLSDRHKAGDFQLYLLDPVSGAATAAPVVDGWVEYLHWSPDGKRILLGVAGHGADVAGGQGAIASQRKTESLPSWTPTVEVGAEDFSWRRAWVYDVASNAVRQVSHARANVWEAVWCGDQAIAAIVSPAPDEGLWYTATLQLIDASSGESRELYRPEEQLGWPAASPSGKSIAVVEARSSDRWIVAGELRLIDMSSGTVRKIDTHGMEISHCEWRSDRHLLLAGHREFDSVVAMWDARAGEIREVWSSSEITSPGRYMSVSGIGESGDCVLIGEGFQRAPEIAVIRGGEYRAVRSFDVGYAEVAQGSVDVEQCSWQSKDGTTIQGWLLRPPEAAKTALVLNVHGGPVWHWRPVWLGRGLLALMLVRRGYAVFLPNPRGSSGRGQPFVRHVYGDPGGGDARDLLSGLDALVERGIADPKRLGVVGGSYGGFMTSWLITQDSRFAAAVPFSPHTNQVTEHLLSNIPHFMSLLMEDQIDNPGGKYFDRSPIMHARKVKTPTLNICGALDRCTPPEEAVQFHRALLEHGVKSALVIYPEEGHGVRKLPALFDYLARVVGWFESHMPARSGT